MDRGQNLSKDKVGQGIALHSLDRRTHWCLGIGEWGRLYVLIFYTYQATKNGRTSIAPRLVNLATTSIDLSTLACVFVSLVLGPCSAYHSTSIQSFEWIRAQATKITLGMCISVTAQPKMMQRQESLRTRYDNGRSNWKERAYH